ncbi:hypothetical protein [Pandoraea pnomenusa]|uniref:hypothetical protein n=1 Tax=Pandoraea pnomenusa TaxID=93220 RepID=UPI002430CF7E|nr:hypothetical protein [Pandoraea pnomenusa]
MKYQAQQHDGDHDRVDSENQCDQQWNTDFEHLRQMHGGFLRPRIALDMGAAMACPIGQSRDEPGRNDRVSKIGIYKFRNAHWRPPWEPGAVRSMQGIAGCGANAITRMRLV